MITQGLRTGDFSMNTIYLAEKIKFSLEFLYRNMQLKNKEKGLPEWEKSYVFTLLICEIDKSQTRHIFLIKGLLQSDSIYRFATAL